MSSKSPRITFAIPFYSNQAYLRKAIESVLNQNTSEWKLLVCDDCGPETGTQELVLSYRDDRIQYFRNPTNLGLGGNWNRCVELATTDFVTLLHADDVLLPNYSELMIRSIAHHPEATAFFCGAQIIDELGNKTLSFPDYFKSFLTLSTQREFTLSGEDGLEALIRGNFIMCPTLCYHKRKLGSYRFDPHLRYVLDLDMTTRILLNDGFLVGLPDIGYCYRRHDESTSATGMSNLTMFQEEVLLYEKLQLAANAKGWIGAAKKARAKRVIKLQVLYYVMRDLWRLNFKGVKSKLKFVINLGA